MTCDINIFNTAGEVSDRKDEKDDPPNYRLVILTSVLN